MFNFISRRITFYYFNHYLDLISGVCGVVKINTLKLFMKNHSSEYVPTYFVKAIQNVYDKTTWMNIKNTND